MRVVDVRWTTAYRLMSLLALAISVTSAVLLTAIYVTSENVTLGGQEQNVIFGIQTLLLGEGLYRDPAIPPFVITQYTPIFYQVCAAICRLFGLRPDQIREIYMISRLVSAVASLGCCLIVYKLLKRHTALDRTMQLALAFFFPLSIDPWSFIARPDPLYLLFIAAAFLAAMDYAKTARVRMLVVSALLLMAGFYTKQTAMFFFPLPFAIGFARNGWRALRPRDIAFCVAIDIAGLVLLNGAMAKNFAIGLANGIDLGYAANEAYLPALRQHIPLLAAAAIGCWLAARRGTWESRAIIVSTSMFLCVGAGLALKWGSATNYFDEFFLGCLLLTGVGLSSIVPSGGRSGRTIALILVGLVIVGQADTIRRSRWGLVSALIPRGQLYQSGYALAADPELRGQRILVLDFTSMLFVPERAVFAPFEVLAVRRWRVFSI